MKAIDTNVVVRAIIRDDPAQSQVARAMLADGDLLILPTVLVEVVWVLGSTYRLSRGQVADFLRGICSLAGVTVVSPQSVDAALSAYAHAGDFADLLHAALAAEAGATALATFDRRFAVPPGLPLALELL